MLHFNFFLFIYQDPPNFLIASDFSKHVKPVAVVPNEPEPEVELDTPDDAVGNLIDTATEVQLYGTHKMINRNLIDTTTEVPYNCTSVVVSIRFLFIIL